MPVVVVSQWRVAPGRVEDFLGLAREAKAILERLGGRVRLFNAFAAGPDTLTRSFFTEVPDWEAYGRLMQALATDAAWQALLPRLYGADPAGTHLSNVILSETPL